KLISDYVSINNVKVINYSEEATDLNFDFYDKKGQIGTVDLSIDYIEISFNNTVYYSLLDAIDLNELQKVLISILDCSYKIITVSKGKQRIKKKYVLTDIT